MTVEFEHARELLHHTWYAFFGRFGNLRAVQRDAVPPIVAGRSVLACAATASGKTEAVVAPLVERLMQARPEEPALGILIVSPTRALCNDLLRRLRPPIEHLGLQVDVKTGDSPGLKDSAPPDVLITTPESLDSMLSRRPAVLRTIQSVMVDELHLLDGTARGDQLRCLLERLRRVVKVDLQVCAASATIPNAPAIASRFLGPDAMCVVPDKAEVTQRTIEATLTESWEESQVAHLVEELYLEAPNRKILVFTNARAQVESIVAGLHEKERLRGKVFAHHGSLSQSLRLRAERSFLLAPSAICVATMTLELGIDIGNVDRVVLVGPPPNVSSLLQRVGRSNRQEDTTHLVCLYQGGFEARRFVHLLECASKSELFEETIQFRPSVAAQQALSLLFQNPRRWIDAGSLHSRLPVDVQPRISESDCKEILEVMTEKGYFHPMDHGRFAADSRALKMYKHGLFHANFEDSADIEVFDDMTGELLGQVSISQRQKETIERGGVVSMALGGKRRNVLRMQENQIFVDSRDGHDHTSFMSRQAPRYTFGLAQSLAASMGYDPGTMHIQAQAKGALLGHFLGTTWARLFEYVLATLKQRKSQPNAFFAALKKFPTEKDRKTLVAKHPFGSAEDIRRITSAAVSQDTVNLARLLGSGPFTDCIPKPVLRDWVEETVDIERFADFVADIRLVEGELF
ncbi:MAG: DEAD/DEAH box helicase [Bradymonadaceae bacterium]